MLEGILEGILDGIFDGMLEGILEGMWLTLAQGREVCPMLSITGIHQGKSWRGIPRLGIPLEIPLGRLLDGSLIPLTGIAPHERERRIFIICNL